METQKANNNIHLVMQKLTIVNYFESENVEIQLFQTGNKHFKELANLDLKDIREERANGKSKQPWRTNDMVLELAKNRNNNKEFEILLNDKFDEYKLEDEDANIKEFIKNEIIDIETRYINTQNETMKMNLWFPQLNQWIEFLNERLKEPQQETKTDTPLQKENLYNEYFRGNTFLLFKGYCDEYNIDNTCRTDLRVLYELINNDGFFVDTMELKHYLKFLKLHLKYDTTELKKINLNIKPNINRTNNYKRIKGNLKLTLK